MKLSNFDYTLPRRLIATAPQNPRDHSRLLVFDKKNNQIDHKRFYQIKEYLQPGDLLIFNDTKVFSARLFGQKQDTGGQVELLLLKDHKRGEWEVMVRGKRLNPDQTIKFSPQLNGILLKKLTDKTWQIKFNLSGSKLYTLIEKIGETPLPPYIMSKIPSLTAQSSKLKANYQTVYADKTGSVAAPTAGLHFTKRLLTQIEQKGVDIEYLTLHVGRGTFEPVQTQQIEDHPMHAEYVELKKSLIRKIRQAKKRGKRIIAVGTTSARTLEALADQILNSKQINDIKQDVNIFIYPGYKFKIIDNLITNFHLPKSTLLMMVSALIGRKKTLEIYNLAIKKKYRFYSFGDAMFLN